MSVRGSKNKIILYIAGVCSIVFVILLYHNATQRLEELEKSYERCHLNEESLSAQLQVNLEYKIRLENSLQEEKNEHELMKEHIQSKLEKERQARDKENAESLNKFTAIQQKYKFLQSQHEDLNLECSKLRETNLIEREEKSRIENQLKSLNSELKLVKESKHNDLEQLKVKYNNLEKENLALKVDNKKLLSDLNFLKEQKPSGSRVKLPDKLLFNPSLNRSGENENILQQPETLYKLDISSTKSSTSANNQEQENIPSGNNLYVNTSTPMINPDAVSSQDKIINAAPVPQPQPGFLQKFDSYDHKENVGAKPEELSKQNFRRKFENFKQGVLHAPDIMNDFGHVPALQQYRERIKLGLEKNNNGGEVGDEGEPLLKENDVENQKRSWRVAEVEGVPFVRQPAANDIPKNQLYNYQAEYDRRKDEGEDDDDVDPLDYHNSNEKNHQLEEKASLKRTHLKLPFESKQESIIIQPK